MLYFLRHCLVYTYYFYVHYSIKLNVMVVDCQDWKIFFSNSLVISSHILVFFALQIWKVKLKVVKCLDQTKYKLVAKPKLNLNLIVFNSIICGHVWVFYRWENWDWYDRDMPRETKTISTTIGRLQFTCYFKWLKF